MQDAGNQAAHIAQDAGDAIAKGAQDAGAEIADGDDHAAKHRHEPLPQTLGIGRRTRRLAEQLERVRRYGAYHRRLAALRPHASGRPPDGTDPRSVNVGLDAWDFKPVSEQQILAWLASRCADQSQSEFHPEHVSAPRGEAIQDAGSRQGAVQAP